MARKSQYISKITTKDIEMLKAFSRVGYLSESMLRTDLRIAERRITNFARDKYIEKYSLFNKQSKKTENVYRLSSKGQKFVERELGICRFYRSSSASHDLALANKYLSLSNTIRDSWITESEARDMFHETIKALKNNERFEEYTRMLEDREISPVDACYVNEQGESIGVEITTNSYGQAEIEAKHEFCCEMNLKAEFIRI